MKPLILVLFAQEYDELGLDPLIAGHDDYEFVREGFDFFTFPQNARILWFDVERFVDELAHKYRDRRVAAVVSTHQFGKKNPTASGEKTPGMRCFRITTTWAGLRRAFD